MDKDVPPSCEGGMAGIPEYDFIISRFAFKIKVIFVKHENKVYVVFYAVKIDSEASSYAFQTIPKTLYLKKIYTK